MEYNTTRKKLAMPEYGRNVQKMILYAISIEDDEKRLKAANVIVNIMAQMHPKLKETADYKHKLWDHLYIISDWEINVEGPYPIPSKDVLQTKPSPLTYSEGKIKYRPYGKNIETIIEKAIAYEEGPEKEAFMKSIANHLYLILYANHPLVQHYHMQLKQKYLRLLANNHILFQHLLYQHQLHLNYFLQS